MFYQCVGCTSCCFPLKLIQVTLFATPTLPCVAGSNVCVRVYFVVCPISASSELHSAHDSSSLGKNRPKILFVNCLYLFGPDRFAVYLSVHEVEKLGKGKQLVDEINGSV